MVEVFDSLFLHHFQAPIAQLVRAGTSKLLSAPVRVRLGAPFQNQERGLHGSLRNAHAIFHVTPFPFHLKMKKDAVYRHVSILSRLDGRHQCFEFNLKVDTDDTYIALVTEEYDVLNVQYSYTLNGIHCVQTELLDKNSNTVRCLIELIAKITGKHFPEKY